MPDEAEYPGTPRWVKVTALVALGLLLLALVVALLVGGDHGPARHGGA